MSRWVDCTLADLGNVITGKTPSTKNSNYWDGLVPFVTPKDLQVTKHLFSTERYISDHGLEAVKGAKLPANAVCVSCIGNLGYVAVTMKTCVSNQQINSIVINDDNDSDFVFYLLKNMWEYFKQFEGQSTALSILNKTQFSKIKVSVPDRQTQSAIANILSSIDDKIELNQKINANLQAQAAAVFKSWFVDFEPWGGEMPEDWEYISFDTFLKPRVEKTDDQSVPIFSVTNTGIYPREDKFNKKLSKAGVKNKIVKKGDLVFGMSRSILNWGVFLSDIGAVSSAYHVFEVDPSINSLYLEGFIKSRQSSFNDLIRPSTREGQSLDKGALMQKSIFLPNANTLEEYYRLENSITSLVKEKTDENLRLAAIRDALLPKLMSGEIDVSEVEVGYQND